MKLYNYTPQDDLTVKELSDIMKVLFVSIIEGIQGSDVKGADDLQIDDIILEAFTEEQRRHFTVLEETDKISDVAFINDTTDIDEY